MCGGERLRGDTQLASFHEDTACLSLFRLCRPTRKQAAHLGPSCTRPRRTRGGDRKRLLSPGRCAVEAAASGPGVPGATPSRAWRVLSYACTLPRLPASSSRVRAAGRSSGRKARFRSGAGLLAQGGASLPPGGVALSGAPGALGGRKQFHASGRPRASWSLEGWPGPTRSGCPQAWHLLEAAGDGGPGPAHTAVSRCL